LVLSDEQIAMGCRVTQINVGEGVIYPDCCLKHIECPLSARLMTVNKTTDHLDIVLADMRSR